MEALKIEVTKNEEAAEVAVVKFVGELDSTSVDQIGAEFEKILKENYTFVVAEMSKAKSISSIALGELMGCRTQLVEKGGDLVMAGLSLAVREKLTAMDANKIFKFCSDVRSAMNAYKWEYHGRSESVEVSIPSKLRFVPPVRQLISRVARQKGYGNRDSFRIETIIDEICNNAVEHGVEDRIADIDLQVSIDSKKIEIKVVNVSDPDKLDSLKELSKNLFVPKLDDEDKRGRGLALVKMLSNDFQIEYSDVGTCVHVTKVREE